MAKKVPDLKKLSPAQQMRAYILAIGADRSNKDAVKKVIQGFSDQQYLSFESVVQRYKRSRDAQLKKAAESVDGLLTEILAQTLSLSYAAGRGAGRSPLAPPKTASKKQARKTTKTLRTRLRNAQKSEEELAVFQKLANAANQEPAFEEQASKGSSLNLKAKKGQKLNITVHTELSVLEKVAIGSTLLSIWGGAAYKAIVLALALFNKTAVVPVNDAQAAAAEALHQPTVTYATNSVKTVTFGDVRRAAQNETHMQVAQNSTAKETVPGNPQASR